MIFIFTARIVDVSIGTIRIILISRGHRYMAPFLGFFEILIWLMAISTAMQNINNFGSYLLYAAGFSIGNYVGMVIEAKLSPGYRSIKIITSNLVEELPVKLRQEGFGVTVLDGKGMKGDVYILFSVVPKRDVNRVIGISHDLEPDAFITVEDIKSQYTGYIEKKTPVSETGALDHFCSIVIQFRSLSFLVSSLLFWEASG